MIAAVMIALTVLSLAVAVWLVVRLTREDSDDERWLGI